MVLDRPLQEEEKWPTQSTDLTIVFSTGTSPQDLPDVSLSSASLITSCSWQTLSTLNSDHLPILIRLQTKTPSNTGLRRTYVNLNKVNCDRYKQVVEAALSKRSLPTAYQRDEKIFCTVLFKAASHHIPNNNNNIYLKSNIQCI